MAKNIYNVNDTSVSNNVPVSLFMLRSITDSERIALGPNLVPVRFEAPTSSGTPTKHTSSSKGGK